MSEIAIAVGVAGGLCGIVFGFIAFSRNKKKDDTEDGAQSAQVLTEIGYIKSGIDDIKRKQEKQDAQHIDVITRITAVEASTKQAHKRMDLFESRNGGKL